MGGPVVFLDKDGTLVEGGPCNVDPARIRLAPGAADGPPRVAAAGFRLAVVSYQSGAARGYFPEAALKGAEGRLGERLRDIGASLAGFVCCPHHPKGMVAGYAARCGCRKPAPGMVLAAARDLRADPRACRVVGDVLDDVGAGRRAGCRTVPILNGNETEWLPGPFREPHFRAADLGAAADIVLRRP